MGVYQTAIEAQCDQSNAVPEAQSGRAMQCLWHSATGLAAPEARLD